MLVLAIVGGIILALVLLPFLGPIAVFVGIGAIIFFIIGASSGLIEILWNALTKNMEDKKRNRLAARLLAFPIGFALMFFIGFVICDFDLSGMMGVVLGASAAMGILALVVVFSIQKKNP